MVLTATTSNLTVSRAIDYLSDNSLHLNVSTFDLQFPISHADILQKFLSHIQCLVCDNQDERPQSSEGLTTHKKKIVAVIDSIVSIPGALLPWKQMVSICKDYGVWSIVDAAHSIGQEQGINLAETQPDFWISVSQTCHTDGMMLIFT